MTFFHTAPFVRMQHEHDDIYSFFFQKPKHFAPKAGKHAIFFLANMSRPHPFSIASSPDEKEIRITTHTKSNTRFKRSLLAMKKGDRMYLAGPIMNFTFREGAYKYAFLAQGVGITPFRSMLLDAQKHHGDLQMTLVHVDAGSHTFRKELEPLATAAHYVNDVDAFQTAVKTLETDQLFYLSGSPRFIRATKDLLYKQGVKSAQIVTDAFFGY